MGRELSAAALALGLVAKGEVVTRLGAAPGEGVYLSGRAGLGNAYALARLDRRGGESRFAFLPRARLDFAELLRRFASCAMDTSDGVIATLDELSRTNGVGFALTADPASILHPRAVDACRRRGIPSWLALAGCHGELELVLTVPPAEEKGFLAAAGEGPRRPARIGCVTERPGIALAWNGRARPIDSAWIRNLRMGETRNVKDYIDRLVGYARGLGD